MQINAYNYSYKNYSVKTREGFLFVLFFSLINMRDCKNIWMRYLCEAVEMHSLISFYDPAPSTDDV